MSSGGARATQVGAENNQVKSTLSAAGVCGNGVVLRAKKTGNRLCKRLYSQTLRRGIWGLQGGVVRAELCNRQKFPAEQLSQLR